MDALLALVDTTDRSPGDSSFHSEVCEAYAYATGLSRTALIMQTVGGGDRIMGAFGLPKDRLDELQPTPAEAKRLREAARRAPVLLLGSEGGPAVAPRYVEALGISTLACVPLHARRRPLGLMVGDRGGEAFDPAPEERTKMWLAGKLAAVALIARSLTVQQYRVQRLKEWTDFSRRVHERVVQRLAGVSMMMGLDRGLTEGEHRGCERELARALADLREHLEMPLRIEAGEETGDLRGKLLRLAAASDCPSTHVSWDEGVEIPPDLQPLVEHFIGEATANALKHTDPTKLEIRVKRGDDPLVEVINDGVSTRQRRKPGIGQRLLAAEALMHGCSADFGPVGSECWRARLSLSEAVGRGADAMTAKRLRAPPRDSTVVPGPPPLREL